MDKNKCGVLGLVLAAFILLLPASGKAQVNILCGGAVTITANLGKIPAGGTLFVKGTCFENLSLAETRTNFTIDGQGVAKIVAKDVTKAAITHRGHRVTIKGFDISAGNVGIDVRQGGIATILGNTIHDNGTGIRVRDVSNAGIGDGTDAGKNIITTNGADGVRVGTESGATVSRNSITVNGGRGVRVELASHAAIDDSTISFNGSEGIEVANDSTATIGSGTGNTISSNTGSGVRVRRSASAQIGNITTPSTINDNVDRGVRVEIGSSATIDGSTINSNGSNGIEAAENANIDVGLAAGCVTPCNTIMFNFGAGITLSRNSNARIVSNTISSNGTATQLLGGGKDGIALSKHSFADIANNTIEGNGDASSVCPGAGCKGSGIAVKELSGVNLGKQDKPAAVGPPATAADPFTFSDQANFTTPVTGLNADRGLNCSVGSYVSGLFNTKNVDDGTGFSAAGVANLSPLAGKNDTGLTPPLSSGGGLAAWDIVYSKTDGCFDKVGSN